MPPIPCEFVEDSSDEGRRFGRVEAHSPCEAFLSKGPGGLEGEFVDLAGEEVERHSSLVWGEVDGEEF